MASQSLDETTAGVRVERVEGVVTVTLDRPHRKNAVTPEGWARLGEIVSGVELGRDRVVVVTGADDTFCAGADLAQGTTATDPLVGMGVVGRTCAAIFRCPVPTIAAVDGAAVGAGMNLALACDFVIATERARFSEIFIERSLSVDFGGSWLLPRLVGMARAKQLIMLGEFISGPEAHRLGLIHDVVTPEALGPATSEMVERLASKPARALSMSKSLINGSFEVGLEGALDDEAWTQTINLTSPEAQEAFAAFFRKPVAASPPGTAGPNGD